VLRWLDAQTGELIGQAFGHVDKAFTFYGKDLLSDGRKISDLLWAKLIRNMSRKEWHDHVSPNIGYIVQCFGLPIPPDESETELKMRRANEAKN